jgi:oxygen-independent coproporphyrinogen III oxidase
LKGLYIHVPFCVHKCSYCDFYSLAGRGELKADFVQAILEEAKPYPGESFQTLYLGGGTPSLLGPDLLLKLIKGLREQFDLSGLKEATMEVNPDSATADLLDCARSLGFTRISIGVQSFNDAELTSVGRVHNADQAKLAIKKVQTLGFPEISVDLIAGLPGQTWTSLEYSLRQVTDSGIDHVSLYCLAVEEGTPLAKNIPADLPSEDVQVELFDRARVYLEGRGFTHYEISNFATSGHECQHNLIYWRGGEYLGLGPAAASHQNGKRFRNKADLGAYIKNPTGQIENIEELNITEKAGEEAMLRLRMLNEGLDILELDKKYGIDKMGGIKSKLDKLADDGALIRTGTRYRLVPSRVMTSNPIFAEVLA